MRSPLPASQTNLPPYRVRRRHGGRTLVGGLGAVPARALKQIGSGDMERVVVADAFDLYEDPGQAAARQLSDDVLQRARAEGEAMSLEEAIAYAAEEAR